MLISSFANVIELNVQSIFARPRVVSKLTQKRIHYQPNGDFEEINFDAASMSEEEQREKCRKSRMTTLYKMALVWMAKNDGGSRFKNPCAKYWPRRDNLLMTMENWIIIPLKQLTNSAAYRL